MPAVPNPYLEAIKRKDPALAMRLEAIDEVECRVYAPIQPGPKLDEASTWFIPLEALPENDVLNRWLSGSIFHRLILISRDLKEFVHWLSMSHQAHMVLSLQVEWLVANDSFGKVEEQIRQYLWQSPGFKTGFYDPHRSFQAIEESMLAQAHQRLAIIGEITRYGSWNWPNILRRLISVEKEKSYYQKEAWTDVPVLICGGGPSVDAVANALSRVRDYFFVISAGTGINVLEGHGIEPHLAMSVDPFRAQFSRFCLVNHLEQMHAASWRSNYRALSCLSGPRYLLPGSDAYPMTRLWQEAFHLEDPVLDEGHNVVGMAMSVAKILGSHSIGLLGIDLALSEGKLYGAHMGSTEKRWQGYSQLEETPILGKSVTGQTVMTFPKWLSEAKWICQFNKQYEEKGKLYRVGNLGLAIDGVPSQELSVEGLAMRDYDAWGWREYVRAPKLYDLHPLTGYELLEVFAEKLNRVQCFLDEKVQSLADHLLEAGIDLETGPSKVQIGEPLPMMVELELDEVQLDLEMTELYRPLLEIWSQCHKRVFECGFEIWSNGSISWLEVWLVKARLMFLSRGITTLLLGCQEAKQGYFHVSDEV